MPCDVKALIDQEWTEPDLELEGSHLGRGDSYFDEEVSVPFFVTFDMTFGVTFDMTLSNPHLNIYRHTASLP